MGSILFVDTETVGVPKNYKDVAWNLPNWPRLVQVGYQVYRDGKLFEERELLVRPDGFSIPEEATKIHGISQSEALENGHDLKHVMLILQGPVNACNTIVGHNLSFDIHVLAAEFIRCGFGHPFIGKLALDTMVSTVDLCKIPFPSGTGYKWPKLQELYQVLFGKELEQKHTALSDISYTAECYFELVKRGVNIQTIGVL